MMAWIVTGVLALIVVRIVWLEILGGRRRSEKLARTNEEIATITRNATESYRAKFGKDPTGTFNVVEMPKVASKKP